MQLECPATVVTLAAGEVACQDTLGAPVAWVVVPTFDVSQLESADLGAAYAAGFVLVGTGLVIGKGVSFLLETIRGRH